MKSGVCVSYLGSDLILENQYEIVSVYFSPFCLSQLTH